MLFDDRFRITYYLRLLMNFCCEKTRINQEGVSPNKYFVRLGKTRGEPGNYVGEYIRTGQCIKLVRPVVGWSNLGQGCVGYRPSIAR
jgi:hypothetical protein